MRLLLEVGLIQEDVNRSPITQTAGTVSGSSFMSKSRQMEASMIGALKQTAAHGTQNGKLAKCIVGGLRLHLYWSRHLLLGHKEP